MARSKGKRPKKRSRKRARGGAHAATSRDPGGERATREVLTLSDEHRAWLTHNLVRGVRPERLVDDLVAAAEVPREIAEREVADAANSPALPLCRRYARYARSLELVLELTRARELSNNDRVAAVERVDGPIAALDVETFFARHYAAGRPLLIEGATRDWPALERWSLDHFAERYGDVAIDACVGRDADPEPDANFSAHTRRMPMRDFIARVREAIASGESNDVYLIANNRALERDELAPLFDDIVLDERLFERERLAGGTSLWIGPAGTLTPMHHDTSNILFCQIRGRKRFNLIPPTELSLQRSLVGFYAHVTPDELPAQVGSRLWTVEVGPGDALFLPAGWFHDVRALEPSISFSLLCFRYRNNYDWYRPGSVRLGG